MFYSSCGDGEFVEFVQAYVADIPIANRQKNHAVRSERITWAWKKFYPDQFTEMTISLSAEDMGAVRQMTDEFFLEVLERYPDEEGTKAHVWREDPDYPPVVMWVGLHQDQLFDYVTTHDMDSVPSEVDLSMDDEDDLTEDCENCPLLPICSAPPAEEYRREHQMPTEQGSFMSILKGLVGHEN